MNTVAVNDLNWNDLPNAAKIAAILDASLSGDSDKVHPTPYQFTLSVMFGVYCCLQGNVRIGSRHARTYVASGPGKKSNQCPSLERFLAKRKRIPNPAHKTALRQPLRAIAYFSWEADRRVFLVRRVYPTIFDFLSYSHVPEGWGALGVMTEEILAKKYRNESKVHTTIKHLQGRPTLVPYLKEVKRLAYDSILVVPVFQSDKNEISDLLGSFAFYFKDFSALPPPDKPEIQNRFRALALSMRSAIMNHEEKIGKLSTAWLDLLKGTFSRQTRSSRDAITLLEVTLHGGGRAKDLDQVIGNIMRELGGNEYFGVVDSDGAKANEKTIFIVARDNVEKMALEQRVCSIVGKALRGKRLIYFDLSFRRS